MERTRSRRGRERVEVAEGVEGMAEEEDDGERGMRVMEGPRGVYKKDGLERAPYMPLSAGAIERVAAVRPYRRPWL